jgi:hypothetical protein
MLAGQVLCPLSHAAPALFALVILEMGSHFLPKTDWTTILLFKLPTIADQS